MYRPLSATRTRRCEIRPCLRMLSASNAATRSAPVLAWRDEGNLCVCRAGRCGHRPLRLFIGNRCVGAGLPDDPNRTCTRSIPSVGADAHIGPHRRISCFYPEGALPSPRRPLSSAFPVMCHCELVTDVTGVAIRPPTLCLSSHVLTSYRITSISNPPCSARYVWGAGRIRFHRPTPCRPFSAARRNLA